MAGLAEPRGLDPVGVYVLYGRDRTFRRLDFDLGATDRLVGREAVEINDELAALRDRHDFELVRSSATARRSVRLRRLRFRAVVVAFVRDRGRAQRNQGRGAERGCDDTSHEMSSFI